jgi:hypothetical protein
MSSNKIFVSATLISLAVFSAGCNSNLSTGHPNTNKKGTTNGTPTAIKPGSSASTTPSGSLTPNAKIAGIFACENVQDLDPCMNDEYITISNDFKTLTLEATGMLPDAPNCHMLQVMTLNAPTGIDKNGVVSYTATVGNWQLDSDGLKDNTCTAAFNSATLPSTGNSITLAIDGSGNVLSYVNVSGNVSIELTRTNSTTGSGTQVDAPADPAPVANTPSVAAPSTGSAAPAAPAAPSTGAAPAAASLDLGNLISN